MLLNQKHTEIETHVEFIDYTGRYPNLCHGVLTLRIDGELQEFGDHSEHQKFWTPPFCPVSARDEWNIDVELLPEKFRKYAAEIDNVFNGNVTYGHCGGCM